MQEIQLKLDSENFKKKAKENLTTEKVETTQTIRPKATTNNNISLKIR